MTANLFLQFYLSYELRFLHDSAHLYCNNLPLLEITKANLKLLASAYTAKHVIFDAS